MIAALVCFVAWLSAIAAGTGVLLLVKHITQRGA